MPWMVIRVVAETGEKNVIKNGDGLDHDPAHSRLAALMRRCPVGQHFEAHEYPVDERETFMERMGILDASEFL